jgi:hypothetical protein
MPQWRRPFAEYARQAASLLRTYPEEAIFKALASPQGRKAYSLLAPWLVPLFEKEAATIRLRQEGATAPPPPATTASSTPPQPSPSSSPRPGPAFRPSRPSRLSRLQDE